MKVLQINKLYYPFIGGVEKVVYDIANELKNEVDMEILVCNTENKLIKEEVNFVKVTRVPSLGIFFSMPLAPKFPIYLRKYNVDILHFHFPFPLADFSYLLGKKPRGKVVVTWHSDIVKQKFILKFYGPLLKLFLDKYADIILTTSPQMIENSPFLNQIKHKCRVVPLGIDTKPLIMNVIMQNGVNRLHNMYGEDIILFVGRLVYYKGVEYLIRAMKKVRKGKLLIVGDGDLKDELIALTNELGISEKVIFLGRASDEELPVYYHACKLFVLPSIASSEAFGLVQLEAMACGKPIISTNLPTGVPFVNEDGKTGIVVEPGNSDELSEAIDDLMHNEVKCKRFGEYARSRVYRQFTREKMAKDILNIYEEVLTMDKN